MGLDDDDDSYFTELEQSLEIEEQSPETETEKELSLETETEEELSLETDESSSHVEVCAPRQNCFIHELPLQERTTRFQKALPFMNKIFRHLKLKNISLVSQPLKACVWHIFIQMRAAKTGNHNRVEKLLKRNADPNTKEIDPVKTVITLFL